MLLLPLVVLQLGLEITALVDLVRRERVVGGRKWIWAVVIVCFSLLGAVVYFAAGRKD